MLKRIFDFLGALAGLIIFAVPMSVIAACIRVTLGSPVLFRQVRPGLKAKPFTLYKFRTMEDLKSEEESLLPDKKRLTSLGNFLRSTSMDELPTLFNVLIGEMSLVGPRPLLMEYLPLYSDEQFKRHDVKPGITGWAQVNGRNAISWEEKFNLDISYVEHQSILFDIKILYMTIMKVLRREDIDNDDLVTMPLFTGTKGRKNTDVE